jgi:putative transposase
LDFQTKQNLILPNHSDLSIARQTQLLDISRSGFYYQPVPVSPEEIRIMGFMDKIFTDCPFYGSRKIKHELESEPYETFICREHVQHLMRQMGLEAIYPKKRTTVPNQQHLKYPYLLKNLPIIRPNQVWGTDITYIKLKDGFCYLVALLDWFSRYVITWTLAETLDIDFCIENLQRALQLNIPEIHNSDQGSHFTSPQYTGLLTAHPSIQISMDGRGRCMDNIFTERLWRTIKYENVYISDYGSHREAKAGIGGYFDFYNNHRKHQSLGYRTPAQLYFQN